jgi:hypothetical protein
MIQVARNAHVAKSEITNLEIQSVCTKRMVPVSTEKITKDDFVWEVIVHTRGQQTYRTAFPTEETAKVHLEKIREQLNIEI